MASENPLKRWGMLLGNFLRHPRQSLDLFMRLPEVLRANAFCRHYPPQAAVPAAAGATQANPLTEYFDSHREGRGIWKYRHYFDLYHRHLNKFRGRPVHIVEVGIYSGGSLDMWKHYFGPQCRVYGVDIQEACKAYADERTQIFIGDQADRDFWRKFRQQVPEVDILIDDGGHVPEQQIVTLEEMLPHLRPGGVYLCEDVGKAGNPFAAFVHQLADRLNEYNIHEAVVKSTPCQQALQSVHLYPFVAVIEKNERLVRGLAHEKRGTQWQPFFEGL